MSKGTQTTSLLIAAVLHLVRALHNKKRGMKRETRLQIENQIFMLIHQIAELHMSIRRNELLYRSLKEVPRTEATTPRGRGRKSVLMQDFPEIIKLIKLWKFHDASMSAQLEEKLRYLQQHYD